MRKVVLCSLVLSLPLGACTWEGGTTSTTDAPSTSETSVSAVPSSPNTAPTTTVPERNPVWPSVTTIGVFLEGEFESDLAHETMAIGPGRLTLDDGTTWRLESSVVTNSACIEWFVPESGVTNEAPACLLLMNTEGDQILELHVIPRTDDEVFPEGRFVLLDPVVEFTDDHALFGTAHGFFKVLLTNRINTAKLRGNCGSGQPKWKSISADGALVDFGCSAGM